MSKLFHNLYFQLILVFAVSFGVFYALEFNPRNPYFSGYDSFYHIGMSKLIMEKGLPHEFPYLYFTTINKEFTDNHLLFHLAMIPFIALFGDITGPKIFIALMVGLIFTVLFFFLRKLNFTWALPFTVIAFFLEPSDFYFRLAFIRDPAPALLFLVFGFYLLTKKKLWFLTILAFLYGWLYTGGGFLFLIALIFIYAVVFWFRTNKINWSLIIYPLIATGLSLIVNPYFPANLKSIFLQVWQTGLQAKTYSGGEWYPYDTWFWFSISYVPFLLWLGAILIVFAKRLKLSQTAWVAFLYSSFLLIIQWKSKRFIEYWPFWAVFSAILLAGKQVEIWGKDYWRKLQNEKTFIGSANFWLGFVIVIILTAVGLRFATSEWSRAWNDTAMDYNVPKAKEAHEFLKKNSQFGDIVFTDDWDVFPLYFFLNQKNYYIVGLDPEFMNQYDHDLYEQFAAISSGDDSKDLERIQTLFKAKWVIVKSDHPDFLDNLRNNPDLFQEVFGNKEYFVFRVK